MSQTDEQPDSQIVFFIDRNLGKRIIAEKLREAGLTVEVHDDHFSPDTEDTEWLEVVGNRGWAVLTKDRRFRSRLPELIAMIRAETHIFVLREKKLNGRQQAAAFVTAAPKMIDAIQQEAPPLLATITKSGNLAEVKGLVDLLKRLS